MGKRDGIGRIPDSKMDEYIPCVRRNISLTDELDKRMNKYCDDEERSRSWLIAKAVDEWLKKKGY